MKSFLLPFLMQADLALNEAEVAVNPALAAKSVKDALLVLLPSTDVAIIWAARRLVREAGRKFVTLPYMTAMQLVQAKDEFLASTQIDMVDEAHANRFRSHPCPILWRSPLCDI